MEGVHKAISPPCLRAPFIFHSAQYMQAIFWNESQRACGGIGNHSSIDGSLLGRSAPRCISALVIRGADAPIVFCVPLGHRKAEGLVGMSGSYGIIKVVCVSIMLPTKIEPCLRILMGEDRIVAADVLESRVINLRARPRIPTAWRDR